MNLSFIIGFVVATGLVIYGIMVNGQLSSFFDFASILITIGGTFGALFASFPTKDFIKIGKHMPILFGRQKWDPIYYIDTMTDLSQEARKKGLLALEDLVAEFEDPFLRDSVMLIVDAMEPDKVRDQLDNEMANIESRHSAAWAIYDRGAALAPGFGMIGTLIGLINMLKDMDFEESDGAAKLASSMAVALVTTFYGSFLSNALFIPIGSQLRIAHEEEMLCKEIIVEGIISIQAGENPRHVNEKLMSFLTRTQRERHIEQQDAAAE